MRFSVSLAVAALLALLSLVTFIAVFARTG